MRMITILLAILLAIGSGYAEAKGGRSSRGSGPKTQYVQGYTRADGKRVNGYWRAAAGSASTSLMSGSSDGGLGVDDDDFAGLGKQQDSEPKASAGCTYSAVMTDEEIASCRRNSHNH